MLIKIRPKRREQNSRREVLNLGLLETYNIRAGSRNEIAYGVPVRFAIQDTHVPN